MATINGYGDNKWKDLGIKKTRSNQLQKKTIVGEGEEQEVSAEKFTNTDTGEASTLFAEQDKLKDLKQGIEKSGKGAGEVESVKVGQDNQVTGAKPKNLSKLTEVMNKYGGDMAKNHMGVMSMGLVGAAVGAIVPSHLAVGGMLPFAGIGSVLGALVGGTLTGPSHIERTDITNSGIEKHEVLDSSGLLRDTNRVTTYMLPDGIKITNEAHAKGLQMSREDLTAFDSEGRKLKADFIKDEKTGHKQIRFTNNNGTITTLDTDNMDLTIQSSTDHKEVPAPDIGFIASKSTTGDAKFNNEVTDKKQIIHSDGSTELILNEKSSFYKQNVSDPLHEGKVVEKVIPKHHSYTKVNISSEGDTSVERVDENYRVTVDGDTGEISGKRKNISDKFAGLFRGTLATSLNTQGSFFVGKKKNPEKKGEEVTPFITRETMHGIKDNFTKKKIEEAKKGFKELIESTGPDGTIFLADGQNGRLRALNPDGSKKWPFDAITGDGIVAPPLADKENVYVLGQANELRCIKNGTSGYEKWCTEIKGKIIGDPSFDGDGNVKVFVELDGRKVARTINTRTGLIKESKIVHTGEKAL